MLISSSAYALLALLLGGSSAPPDMDFEHEVQRHSTRLSQALWEPRNDAVACRLVHRIEGYGEARFVARVDDDLAMTLHSEHPQPMAARAELLLLPAHWQNRGQPTTLADIDVAAGAAPVSVENDLARRLFDGLRMGHAGAVRFPSQPSYTTTREVVLLPVHFRPLLLQFDECRARLSSAAASSSATSPLASLPKEVRDSIFFTTDSAELTASAVEKLDQIATAFMSQPAGTRIQLQGFADPRGNTAYNRRLAEQRLFAVRYYLVTQGVPLGLLYAEAVGPTVADQQRAEQLSDMDLSQRRRVDILFLDDA
jgi:outer membrane protein OmpA-like peptidoglycan-associated protein